MPHISTIYRGNACVASSASCSEPVSTTPLLIAAGAGVLFCILAFIGILFVVVRALMFGDPTSGWPSMVCIILLCSGVQLFCTGIVGEYLAKTYLEVKHRPIYIVAETEEDKK